MKNKLLKILTAIVIGFLPVINLAQTINLGTTANFVLFTSVGAITNTGPSHLTGNVGSNSGAATGFGNVNGQMHSSNGVTGLAATDLLVAYGQLNTLTPGFFPASPLGNTATLTAGVYSLSGNSILSNTLTLNAAGTSSAVFVFLINGTFASNANAVVRLTNGAQACNVYWKVEGAVSLASNTSMKGTIIANNAAISISSSVTLEGRALSTTGAIGVTQVLAYTPIGCNLPLLQGPAAPSLSSTACYAIFSSNGAVTNVGVTTVTGDVGSNNGLTTGYNALFVSGSIHAIPDLSTAQCSVDLGFIYTYLNTLPFDIELLYPAQFGNNLVLTPHTYLMNGAVSLTDSLYLNAQGNPNAVFVIKVNGAFSTSVNSKIILINGTQAKNVFWKIDGALSINGNSISKGTFVVNNAAILLATGVNLEGRALTTTGALGTSACTVFIPPISGGSSAIPDQTVCAGATTSFVVSGSGATSFQWRLGTTNLTNSGNISGVTSATLLISPTSSSNAANNYNVVMSGACSSNFTSANISLVVNTTPTLTATIASQTVCEGGTATFTAASSGTGLTYQWRNGTTNLVNSATITGVNTATLQINPVDISHASTNYNLVISGSCTPNFTSSNVSLVVNTTPTITTLSLSQTVCVGSSATFSVNASGTNLTYQWRNGVTNLANSATISGATSSVMIINPVSLTDASINYNVIVSGACSPNFTSINISLVVNTSPTITTISLSQTVCEGSSATFTVAANGAGLTYQWRNGTVNIVNSTTISGATSATLSINPVNIIHASNNYNVVVSGSCSPGFTSTNISLVVNTTPTITAAILDQTVCAGSNVQFSVTASGTGLSYQWRNGIINLSNGGSISGATSATLVISPTSTLDASNVYNVVISGACAPAFTSANISLVVNSSPSITAISLSQTVCVGTPISFTVAANGTGLSYQWRDGNTNLVNGGAVLGASTSSLSINPTTTLNTSTNYNVIVSGVCSPNFTSGNISLLINTSPTVITAVADQTVCEGSVTNFSVNASGSNLTYQWRNGNVNLINSGNISGATSNSLTLNPVTFTNASTNYNLIISGSCAPDYTSGNITLVVNQSPTIVTQAISQTVCAGSLVNFNTIATGNNLIYQWRIGTVNIVNGTNINGANTATLTITNAGTSDASANYNLIINGGCTPNFTSSNVGLTVNTSPSITTQAVSQTVCIGTNVSFNVMAIGSGLIYQWRLGTVNLINANDISGANSATLLINNAKVSDSGNNYNVIVTGLCTPSYTSNNVELLVNLNLVATPNSIAPVCTGSIISLSTSSTSGATYYWSGPNTFSSSVQNPTIANASGTSAGIYSLTINTNSCSSNTGTVLVSVITCINDDFFIPQGFSPNGDGINDFFVIRGISNFPNNNFVIFNRWGNKVFESTAYNNTFDGKSNLGLRIGGDELPVGTYFYVLDLGNNTPFYKGTIYLNR